MSKLNTDILIMACKGVIDLKNKGEDYRYVIANIIKTQDETEIDTALVHIQIINDNFDILFDTGLDTDCLKELAVIAINLK